MKTLKLIQGTKRFHLNTERWLEQKRKLSLNRELNEMKLTRSVYFTAVI